MPRGQLECYQTSMAMVWFALKAEQAASNTARPTGRHHHGVLGVSGPKMLLVNLPEIGQAAGLRRIAARFGIAERAQVYVLDAYLSERLPERILGEPRFPRDWYRPDIKHTLDTDIA